MASASPAFDSTTNDAFLRPPGRASLSDVAAKAQVHLTIDPESSTALIYWDATGSVLLGLVALLTPLEAGFLSCSVVFSTRWIFNMFATFYFMCDLSIQFFLPYQVPTRFGHRIERRHSKIAKHYAKRWMLVDFVSVVPFELIYPCGREGLNLGVLRTIRLLRLLKLLRLLRGIRMVQRWHTTIGFSMRKSMLYQLLGFVMIAAHWLACFLGIMSRLQQEECPEDSGLGLAAQGGGGCRASSWLAAAVRSRYDFAYDPTGDQNVLDAYLVALHASMSIIAHPHSYQPTSSMERACFILLMLLGGIFWTQIISRSTAIITSLSKHSNAHLTRIDDLNSSCADLSLPHDLRKKLRRFFLCMEDASKYDTWKGIVHKMSPKLRRDACREINRNWLTKINFLSSCSAGMLAEVAEAMENSCFSELERFGSLWTMYILIDGMAVLRGSGKVSTAGAVWGEDHLLLSCEALLSNNAAGALAFAQCQTLTRKNFMSVVARHPEEQKRLRTQTVKLAIIRGIRTASLEARAGQDSSGPLSEANVFQRQEASSRDHHLGSLQRSLDRVEQLAAQQATMMYQVAALTREVQAMTDMQTVAVMPELPPFVEVLGVIEHETLERRDRCGGRFNCCAGSMLI